MEDYDVTVQCRSCLSTNSAEYIDMESSMSGEYTYLECFNICTNLKASSTDDLPVTICTGCSHDLQVAFEFVQVARQADAVLRESLERHKETASENSQEMERFEYVGGEETEVDEEIMELNEEDSQMEVVNEEEYREITDMEEQSQDESSMEHEYLEEKSQVEEIVVELQRHNTRRNATKQRNKANAVKEEVQESYPEDEVDDEYLIEYNEADINVCTEDSSNSSQLAPQGSRWKCIECKKVLRGDVSYEGHMNMHRNVKPYKCTQCKSAFRCKLALERHATIRHATKTVQKCFSCDLCDKVFRLSTLLLEHRRTEHKILESCTKCSKTFKSKEILAQHMSLIHPPNNTTPIQCPFCTHPPLTKVRLVEHLRLHHPIEHRRHLHTVGRPCDENKVTPWQCEECFRYYRTEALLKDHQNMHNNERPHVCTVCDKRFFTANNLRSHMRSMHQAEYEKRIAENLETMVQCDICKKKLLKKNFEKHIMTHERKEKEAAEGTAKFLCAYCPRECKNQKTLAHHEKLHQSEASGIIYQCVDCERNYATIQHLEQHRKQAHKERDHVCPICGNAFKLKNQLVNHMKLHLEKNIPCPHCDKKYARQFDLNVHLRSHTGELPYACHLCDKRFAIKVRLTYHLQKHMGVKHRCKECGAEFNSKQKLKSHSYKHTGMPYRCEMCDHGFANRDVFKRHLLRVHNTTMTDEALVEMFQRNTGKTTRIRPIDELEQYVLKTEEEEVVEEFMSNEDELSMVEEIVQD